MGGLFGAGRLIGNTGIYASQPVPNAADAALAVVSLLAVRDGKLVAAMAGGGDRSAPQALAEVAVPVIADRQALDRAIGSPRLFAASGKIYAEAGFAPAPPAAASAARIGSVNAVACPEGLPNDVPTCAARADPRSIGLAGVAQGL
jgi:hypothetical protein